MKILVTGSGGQVGLSFQKIALHYENVDWHFVDRSTLDISNKNKVNELVNALCPDVIINCAAYTAVDRAESEPEKAYLINDTAVGHLAQATKRTNCLLVHYSSDYVYHNGQSEPLKETDPKSPMGIYAISKLNGEQKILDSGANAIIVRTSWVYSEFGRNFVKTMLRLGSERDHLTVVDDQIGCPTYATDIAVDTMKLVSRYYEIPDIQVITNYTADGKISWYEFAKEIFNINSIDVNVDPIPSSSYPTPADRPKNSVLDLSYCTNVMGLELRDWKHSVKECSQILNGLS